MKQLEDYIKKYKDTHTREQIDAQLLKANYPNTQIQAAWDKVQGIPAPEEPIQLGQAPGIKQIGGQTYIQAKLGALEVLKWTKRLKAAAIIGIGSPLVILLLDRFSFTIASIGMLIPIGISTFYIFQSQKETQRLKTNYHLK